MHQRRSWQKTERRNFIIFLSVQLKGIRYKLLDAFTAGKYDVMLRQCFSLLHNFIETTYASIAVNVNCRVKLKNMIVAWSIKPLEKVYPWRVLNAGIFRKDGFRFTGRFVPFRFLLWRFIRGDGRLTRKKHGSALCLRTKRPRLQRVSAMRVRPVTRI